MDMTFYGFNAHRRKITCALNMHTMDFRMKNPTLTLKDFSVIRGFTVLMHIETTLNAHP